MAGRVVVIGSANLDLVVETARVPAPGETLLGTAKGRFAGGKGLNQAIGAARSGAQARLCAVVGVDDAGVALADALAAAGAEGDLRRDAEEPTGVAHVLALPGGENSIVVAAGANGAMTAADAEAVVSRGADVVLAQLEVPPAAVVAGLRAARAQGILTILNAAPAHESAIDLLPDVDVLIVNESECAALGGVPRLLAAGAGAVVRTLGGAGSELHRPREAAVTVPAFRVDAVDTTGAGDAFCGALAAAVANGVPLEGALVRASAAGAIVAQHLGANTDALSDAAIDELVRATR